MEMNTNFVAEDMNRTLSRVRYELATGIDGRGRSKVCCRQLAFSCAHLLLHTRAQLYLRTW